jgi:hypothetical protein
VRNYCRVGAYEEIGKKNALPTIFSDKPAYEFLYDAKIVSLSVDARRRAFDEKTPTAQS